MDLPQLVLFCEQGYRVQRLIGRSLSRWLRRPQTVEDRNVRNVLIDGFGVGIASGIGTFLSVFLVRLGATSFQVGLLTAMPALTGMIFAIAISRFLDRQRNIVPWYSRARFLVLSSYMFTGLAPFFFSNRTPDVIIGIWALATIPQTIVNVAFTVVMGQVAGPNRRFYLMSRRWSLLGATNAVVVAAVGQFLDRVAFPINYQIAFMASWVGGLISLYFSSAITLPDREPPAASAAGPQSWSARLRGQVEVFRTNPLFTRFEVSQFVFRWGQSMAIPLFPLYWVRTLNVSDASIGFINTVQGGVLLVAYFFWSRMARRYGNRFVLLACSLGLVLYPFLTAITSSVSLLVVYAALGGMFVAGTDLVIFDVLLATCPPINQTTYVGVHQAANNMAIFFAPLVGTFLADRIGIVPALIIAAALRFAGFALFYLLRVGQPVPQPATTPEVAPVGGR